MPLFFCYPPSPPPSHALCPTPFHIWPRSARCAFLDLADIRRYEGNTFSLKSASKDRQVWEEALAGVSSLSVTSCRMVNAALMKASDTATPLCALRAVLATGSGAPLLIIEYVCTTASARNAGLANMMMTFALEDLAKDIHAQVFIVSTDTALPYWMRPDKGFVPAINDPRTPTGLRACAPYIPHRVAVD